MLDAMRRSARSLGMKFVLMMIVLTFVFMGAGSFITRSPDEVATVNGEPVTVEEFREAHANMRENLRRQYGGEIDDEMLRQMNLEQQVLNSLIDEKLLMQVADKKSLRAGDDAVADAIARIPAFQTNGRFDPQRYQRVLSQSRITPQQFEAMQKESILAQQIQNFIAGTVTVSETEARAWFEWENTEVDIDYVVFSPDDIQAVDASDDEINAYYEDNQDRYRAPARVKARYVSFYPEDFIGEAEVSDEEIQAYYARHESDYKTSEKATASHILIRTPDGADTQTMDEKEEKAWEIYDKTIAGEDFAELARTHSDCPSGQLGGSLGSFSKGDMVPAFSEKAFSLQPGEIGEPVRTRFGWHVIWLEDYQPESVEPLEAVADDIRYELAREKSVDVAYRRAMEMYDISFDADDLVENAERFGYDAEATDFFTRGDGPENIGNAQSFANAAFELPLEEVSDILEIDGGHYILAPINREEAHVPELSEIKEDVKADLKAQKKIDAARNAAADFLEKTLETGSLIEAAQTEDRIVASTGLFARNDPVPGLGRVNELKQTAFGIGEINQAHDSVINVSDRFFVMQLAARVVPDESAFAEHKDQVMNQLSARKQQETVGRWMASLREKSDIKISERFSRHFN